MLFFVFCFAWFYGLHGSRITFDAGSSDRFALVTGDEPQYLLMTHSVAVDGDLNLFNNIAGGDSATFYRHDTPADMGAFHRAWLAGWRPLLRGALRDTDDATWDGRLYSRLPPGLAAVFSPAYAVGYVCGERVRFAVVVWLHALVSLVALSAAWAAWSVSRQRVTGVAVGLWVGLSAPLTYYSCVVYTEPVGALCIALAFAVLLGAGDDAGSGRSAALAVGILAGILPWLHAKFWLHAAYLMVVAAFALAGKGRRRNLVALLLPFALLVGVLGAYYRTLFGCMLPVSKGAQAFSLRTGLVSGWPGLWLDRSHGLLWYAPVVVAAIPGAIALVRKKNGVALAGMALIGVHWLATGMFEEWPAGKCPPLRYWVPVFPLFAIPIAACLRGQGRVWRWALVGLAGLAGLAIAAVGMWRPHRLFDAFRHPVFSYWRWLHYASWTPRFGGNWGWVNTVWCGVAVAAVVAATTISIRVNRPGETR